MSDRPLEQRFFAYHFRFYEPAAGLLEILPMNEADNNAPENTVCARQMAEYLEKLMAADSGFAGHVLKAMREHKISASRLSVAQGRILETLVRAVNARKTVEIGTRAGYYGHWLARGMADGGRLYALENDPICVSAAKECFERSSLSRKVTVLEGPPPDTLKTLSKLAPFDFCFIGSDEENYPAYLRWAALNLRPGGMVAARGAFLDGDICMEGGDVRDNTRARSLREFFHVLFDGDRFVSASIIPAGSGLALGIRNA